MSLTDQEIKKNVVDQLCWDSRVDASNVSVEVKDGKVTLSGTVPTYFSLLSAAKDVWEMPGVTAVDNMLMIRQTPSQQAPDDKRILANVENKIYTNPDIDISEVHVSVKNGEVTITGTVDAYWMKLHIEDMVSQESGVTAIRNQLAVVPTEVYPDQDIARSVIATLERSALVDPAEVTVEVKDGVVTLSGSVSDWAARDNAYRAAVNTAGVVDVINNLRISR